MTSIDAPAHRHADAPLLDEWLPALGRPVDRLDYGGRIAHVGCGRGETTVRLARRFPLASVHGFDPDGGSIEVARAAARAAGVEARCTFVRSEADEVPAGGGYDLLLLVRSLHGGPDPLASARRARKVLARDGVALVVGPDTVAELLLAAGFAEVTPVAATPFDDVVAAHPGG